VAQSNFCMKKIFLVLALLTPVLCCYGQSFNLKNAQKRIINTWIAQGDSLSELDITADSITIFTFRLNGVFHCTYKIVESPCEKTAKSPTGMYLVEQYKDKTKCCALAEVTDVSLKVIYPDGTAIKYKPQSLTKEDQRPEGQ